MFGIDFSELMVILVIALVVIGPERLPKVARTLGHLLGRAQRYVNNVKADISRDMAIEELRQLQQQVQQQAISGAQAADQVTNQITQSIHQHTQQLHSVVTAEASPSVEHAAPEPSITSAQRKFPVD